jgi:hypothetical protein
MKMPGMSGAQSALGGSFPSGPFQGRIVTGIDPEPAGIGAGRGRETLMTQSALCFRAYDALAKCLAISNAGVAHHPVLPSSANRG